MKKILVIIFILLFSEVYAQSSLLQSGPMVGYSEMREVMLWVQTTEPAWVRVTYYEENTGIIHYTDSLYTLKRNACIAKVIADEVSPGKKYFYQVYLNGKQEAIAYPLSFQTQPLYHWRTDAPDFSFAFGSCNYVNDSLYDRLGNPYGGGYEIFTSIYNKHPDFMLWGGDNVYLREADWGTRTGILYRYTHTRSLPQLQPLLGSLHHYALWDDHDYGPNDSDRSFRNKKLTTEAFKMFWANPAYVDSAQGTNGTFVWNDAQFFLLDNRTYRSPNKQSTGEKIYLGKAQMDWLIDALVSSQATFKIVICGGQILNPANVYENYSTYPDERALLLDRITKEKIKGIFFLSGDRHHTELTKMERTGTYPLYDLTVSPLTSGTHPITQEGNTLQVEGTQVNDKNFSIMNFSGTAKARKLIITVYNSKGEELWKKEISASELQ